MEVIVFFAAVFFIPAVFGRCANQSLEFSSDSSRGNTFVTQSAANLMLDYRCLSFDSYGLDVWWLNSSETVGNGRRLGNIFHPKLSWNRLDYGNDLKFKFLRTGYGFQLSISILSVNSSNDNSRFLLQDRREGAILATLILRVVCCRASTIPSQLTLKDGWVGEDLNCLAKGKAICKTGAMFVSGNTNDYQEYVDFKCNIGSSWQHQSVDCLPSCPFPPYQYLRVVTPPRNSERYKTGTKLAMICRSGRMHFSTAPNHFFTKAEITCKTNETWTDPEVQCWTGQVVDFTARHNPLLSGKATIFACGARSPLTSRIIFGDNVIKGNETSWANYTLTPDHNGLTAVCEEIDSFNRIVYKREAYLDVRYKPELTATVAPRYEFPREWTEHIAITFRANPVLTLADIEPTKNGSDISNFYLTNNGTEHEVVIHFTKVEPSDGGDYVILITSHYPVSDVLRLNLSIDVTPPRPGNAPFGAPGDISAVVLGCVIVLLAIGAIIAYCKLKEPQNKKSGNKKNTTDVTVGYDASDQPNYEDVDANPSGKKNQSKSPPGRVNMQPSRQSQNAYEAPMRTTQAPPPPMRGRSAQPANYRMSGTSVDSFNEDLYEETEYET